MTSPLPPFPRHLAPDLRFVELIEFDLSEFDLSRECGDAASVLSPGELARAAHIPNARHRQRFADARGVLRLLLGAVLRLPPRQVPIRPGRNGKPEIAAKNPFQLRFNLSYSGDRGLIALSVGREVGVDVEGIRDKIDFLEIAVRFFAPGETASLEAVSRPRRAEAFFRCWTGKQSFVKARGDGLLSRLDAFEVEPAARPTRLRWSTLDASDVRRWQLVPIDLDHDHVAALTVEGTAEIRRWSAPFGLCRAGVT